MLKTVCHMYIAYELQGIHSEPCPFLISFLLSFWRALWPYQPHLEEMDPIWDDDWSYSQQTVFYLRFSGVFLSCKANARRSVHSPQDRFIITLIISDRRHWRDTRGKWPLARNPDRSWWHRHTNWKFFWPQPMAPWTTWITVVVADGVTKGWSLVHPNKSHKLPLFAGFIVVPFNKMLKLSPCGGIVNYVTSSAELASC